MALGGSAALVITSNADCLFWLLSPLTVRRRTRSFNTAYNDYDTQGMATGQQILRMMITMTASPKSNIDDSHTFHTNYGETPQSRRYLVSLICMTVHSASQSLVLRAFQHFEANSASHLGNRNGGLFSRCAEKRCIFTSHGHTDTM